MFKGKAKICIAALVFLAFGCGSSPKSQVPAPKIVNINLGNEPHTLDPREARDTSSLALMRMLFEGLTRIGPNDEPQLALAESVEISQDLKTYTFTLRSSTWSNGDPVRAGDFVYSWRKVLRPESIFDYASQLYLLKNGKGIKDGELDAEALGVIAVDDHTLVVELEYPTPYFLEMLSFPIFFPVHQGVDEAQPDWFLKCETYVSNGPFSLDTWRHHDVLLAKKNPCYWDADTVQIDGVEMIMVQGDTEMKLFEKKQLHWAGSPLSTLPLDALNELKKRGRLHVKPIAGTAFIRVNTSLTPLTHPKLRRALALAIEREAIVEHVTQGGQIPAMGLVPPSQLREKEPHFADGAQAEAVVLFEEALKDLKMTRESFPYITFTYAAAERSHLVAQAIQQQWNATFGIRVTLEAIERKVYFDRISREDYQLALGSWLADFNDPVNFLEVFKYKSQSTNNTHWEDPQYTRLLNDSFTVMDPKERAHILEKCEKILMDAMPVIPLFYYTMLHLKDDRLEDVFLSSLGNLDFKWAHLENDE